MRDPAADAKLEAALLRQCNQTYSAFLSGIERYRAADAVRTLQDPPVIWQQGTTRLLDFGSEEGGQPVLVIPSLINRFHVLDIDETRSYVRAMARAGFHPYLIDWNVPGEEETRFQMDDYFRFRLMPILHFLHETTGKPLHINGYCMGGLLAAALTQLLPEHVGKLLFLATPWDFHADDPTLALRVQAGMPGLTQILDQFGHLPVDALQAFFIGMQPFLIHDKFVKYAKLDENSAEANDFVLVEDWVNDGVPLARHVAEACMQGWYVENQPAKRQWKILGEMVNPAELTHASLHVIPQRDKIVPPESAIALARAMKGAEVIQPAYGHISMLVGRTAQNALWPRLFDWLAS